jgi:lysophospholipase L1-like esterase
MADHRVHVIDPWQVQGRGEIGPFPFEQFHSAIMAQGDSWFSVGAFPPQFTSNIPLQLSLSQSAVVVDCARPGHVLQHMTSTTSDAMFLRQLRGPLARKWHAIMVSGGGNDLIDAVGVPATAPAHQRLLAAPAERPALPSSMDDYISNTGWAVFEAHIGQVFDQLVAERNAGQNRRTPMLFHTYAHLVPRPSGAGLGFGPWLQPWLLHYGVPMVDWAALAARLIDKLADLLQRLVARQQAADPTGALQVVDTRAAALVQAGPTDAQEAGDFCNEIHPNPTGYGKLAAVWRAALDPLL